MKTKKNILPEKGRPAREILDRMHRLKDADARWDNGKMFAFVYTPEAEAVELMHEIARLYLFDNALSPSHFPSLAQMESEVVNMVAGMMHGGKGTVGNITTGGTESILMAMKTARDHARKKNPHLKDMEVILPWSVHPAFQKAAHTLGVKVVTLPLGSDYRADIEQLPGLINEHTFMLVGSSPSYSHGVVDPIAEMGQVAIRNELYFHVDACLGGFFLPFMEKLGYDIPLFDFRVKGVTSISADLHKYGYGSKGASVILYRDREVRRDQFFVHCDWPGGLYGSPTMLGSRSGVPVAVAWAMLQYHGMDGYLEMTRRTLESVQKLKEGISHADGLFIIGEPVMSVFSFSSEKGDIYQVGDELSSRGWILDSIMEPEALHFIVSLQNLGHIDEFLDDLASSVDKVRSAKGERVSEGLGKKVAGKLIRMFPGKTISLLGKIAAMSAKRTDKGNNKTAVFYGIAASVANKTGLNSLVLDFLDKVYSI